jgi:hypothetical protein
MAAPTPTGKADKRSVKEIIDDYIADPRSSKEKGPLSFKTSIKVRATQTGHYGHKRRREGDVFVLAAGVPFSTKWMEFVPASTPTKLTTGKEELKNLHDDLIIKRAGGERQLPEGADEGPDPLGAGTDTE